MVSFPDRLEADAELTVLRRILHGLDSQAEWLLERCDPAWFQTKASRGLYMLLARELPEGANANSVRPLVEAEAPQSLALFERCMSFDSETFEATPPALLKALEAHARTSRFRKALDSASKAIREGTTCDEVRSELERHLSAIDLAALSAKAYDDKADMARRVWDFLDNEEAAGLPFGYAKLDARVTPLMLGNLVIIAGRPGTGKSTDLRNWCRNWVRMGEHVAYLSFEMSGEEKLPLFACMDAGLTYTDYVRRSFNEWDREAFDKALNWWVDCPNFILNERSHVTPEWLMRTIKRYRAMGVTTFIFDHLHRIRFRKDAKGDIRLAMGDFVRDVKSFAVDHQCRAVMGAQFTKGDKHEEPGDDMIRESGYILDEADKIFLKWLPKVAGTRAANGEFLPTIGEGGRRILASEAEKGAELGLDPTRTFVKIGKQRVRTPSDAPVALPFNPYTGVIADFDDAIGLRIAS